MSDYEQWCQDAPQDYLEMGTDALPPGWADRVQQYEMFVSDCEELIVMALYEGRPIDPHTLRARIASRLGVADNSPPNDTIQNDCDIPF